MKFRIHLEYGEHTDYIDIEEDTIEEVREQAQEVVGQRNPSHWWSEEIN